jgi:transposase InsO family protein
VIRRPWAETYRSKERNEGLHWDYLHLGKSFGDYAYLLVLKDDATHYCELVPCVTPTSAVTAEAILDWHSRFGSPRLWISDNGSHFKNDVVEDISRRLNANQNFSLAYSPWINGSVERLNRDIVQVLRAMCLEYKVDIKDWTYFVPVLQANLNHTPVPSLNNRAPIELFCVLPAMSPLDFCLDSRQKLLVEIGEHPQEISDNLERLRESAQAMHRAMTDAREKQTQRNKDNQGLVVRPNFDVGDFVLRSRVDQKYNDKLLVTWIGPYQIVRADEHSFRVRHLVTGSEQDVHASRLKYYADKDFEVTQEIKEHVAAQGIILTVAELKGHRWNSGKRQHELHVAWKGLEPIEDSWESLLPLYKDIPAMVRAYAASKGDAALRQAVAKLEK